MNDQLELPFKKSLDDSGVSWTVSNYLFGVPLYAYYVFQMETFDEGEIDGLLMTPPFEIFGPFDREQAEDVMLSLCFGDQENSKQG